MYNHIPPIIIPITPTPIAKFKIFLSLVIISLFYINYNHYYSKDKIARLPKIASSNLIVSVA